MRFWSAHRGGKREWRVIDLNWNDWAKGSRVRLFEWWTELKENRSGNRKAINWIGKILFSILNFFFFVFVFVCRSVCVLNTADSSSSLLAPCSTTPFAARLCLLSANRYWMWWLLHLHRRILYSDAAHIDNAASVATIQINAASRAHAIRTCIGFCFQYLPSAAVGTIHCDVWWLMVRVHDFYCIEFQCWKRVFRYDAEAATLEILSEVEIICDCTTELSLAWLLIIIIARLKARIYWEQNA